MDGFSKMLWILIGCIWKTFFWKIKSLCGRSVQERSSSHVWYWYSFGWRHDYTKGLNSVYYWYQEDHKTITYVVDCDDGVVTKDTFFRQDIWWRFEFKRDSNTFNNARQNSLESRKVCLLCLAASLMQKFKSLNGKKQQIV